MADVLYVSRVSLEKVDGLVRRARLPTGVSVEMGVHGPIRSFFRLEPSREAALPVDYVVAAAGG
jgi:hypothetical protein